MDDGYDKIYNLLKLRCAITIMVIIAGFAILIYKTY